LNSDAGIAWREDGGVITAVISRPPVNALAIESVEALGRLARDSRGAEAFILTGAGSAFCAGVDTKAFAAYDGARRTAFVHAITAMCAALLDLPCPLVAAVNGHALGGGMVLSLTADWRIAAADEAARMGIPEARAGIPFPAGPAASIEAEIFGSLAAAPRACERRAELRRGDAGGTN
jgi:enoyl-CoA hydratase